MTKVIGRILGIIWKWLLGKGIVNAFWGTFVFGAMGGLITLAISFIPDFVSMAGLNSFTFTFPPSIWYFIDLVKIEFGITTMLTALVARFILRRIPFIG